MFHLISIWLTRIVVMGVAIALAVMYVIPAYFGEQPATSSAPLQAARPAAPIASLAPAAVAPHSNAPAAEATAQPASEPAVAAANSAEPATDAAPAADADSNARPCQPIARTASGDLVYSMDCRRLPAE